jgi:ABC-type branched-subunit amino acid transport system permease subunit
MVVIGGAGSVPGAILGAIVIAGIDQLAIPQLGAWLDSLQFSREGWLALLDIRALNAFYFGLALYLTVLLRAKRDRWPRLRLRLADLRGYAAKESV